MFVVIATCCAYFEECDVSSVNLCKWSFPGAPWDQYVCTQAQAIRHPAWLPVQGPAQSQSTESVSQGPGLSGLLTQLEAFANESSMVIFFLP